jgi:hypothetical protein
MTLPQAMRSIRDLRYLWSAWRMRDQLGPIWRGWWGVPTPLVVGVWFEVDA